MAAPDQLQKRKYEELSPEFQQAHDQLVDAVNSLIGHNGPIQLASHIDLQGNRIQNVGDPVVETDAISHAFAASQYSASKLKPQFEAGGTAAFSSYRQINNVTQRERRSTWLKDLMSTPPSANNIIPILTDVMGGVQVFIPASTLTFSDGSSIALRSLTDTIPFASSFAIATIACVGNVVTITFASPSGLLAGDWVTVSGVAPPSFNGSFVLTGSTGGGLTVTYQLDLGTASGMGGDVETGNIVYYAAVKGSSSVYRIGTFTADTAKNRLKVNNDGFQIIVVVAVGAGGAVYSQSGGGGTPMLGAPTAGSFF